ncbi:MAG: aspartyl protease [Epulopiscium sp.]|nr:aspartyl protease [Candidatus Epulonipiscium sp.]
MKLEYRDGLLFTSIIVQYHGKSIKIDNIVVDTGASYCIIEPNAIESLGITSSKHDEIEIFYGVNGIYSYIKRTADCIMLDQFALNDISFYIGTVDDNINGLLGLDALIKSGALIDLKNMKIVFNI